MMKQMLTAPGHVGPGRRIYAIGDVHGCDDRLATLHGRIAADLATVPVADPVLVHLGDYIDRGPNSAAVIRRLMHPPIPGMTTVNLRGNHEQMMLDALRGGRDDIGHWIANSGTETLRSWGVPPTVRPAAWRSAIPADELQTVEDLRLHHRIDGYLFVHAGVRPGVALRNQSAFDLLWIREEFLSYSGPLLPDEPSLAAVHGHTPQPSPVVTGNRIGVDTGAVKGGALTCAVLEARTVRFLTA